MVKLQSAQHHTGLTYPFKFFDIQALWRSVLKCQDAWVSKIKKGGLDKYGAECFGIDSFLPQSENMWEWKG